jgi:hypothetical protein
LAVAQTAINSMAAVSGMFGSKSFYWRLMASLFPRPHAMWFLFVTELENKVYRRNTHILHEREEHIQEEIFRISPAELQCVNQSVFSLCTACLWAQGEHFQHFVWISKFASKLILFSFAAIAMVWFVDNSVFYSRIFFWQCIINHT